MSLIFLWNGRGDTREFTREAFAERAQYVDESGTPEVFMYRIDGEIWFVKGEDRPWQCKA